MRSEYENEYKGNKSLVKKLAIKKLFKEEHLELHLNATKVNSNVRGCSGFILNRTNNKIVYISTECNLTMNKILYRTARHIKDYTGLTNNYSTLDNLHTSVLRFL